MIRRFALPLALGLVLAALVAPAALAKPVSSDVLNGGYDAWAVGQQFNGTVVIQRWNGHSWQASAS